MRRIAGISSLAAIAPIIPETALGQCVADCPVHMQFIGLRLIVTTRRFQEIPDSPARIQLQVRFDDVRRFQEAQFNEGHFTAPTEWIAVADQPEDDKLKIGGTTTFSFWIDESVRWYHPHGRPSHLVAGADISITLLGDAEWEPGSLILLSEFRRATDFGEGDLRWKRNLKLVAGIWKWPDLILSSRPGDRRQATYSFNTIYDRIRELGL